LPLFFVYFFILSKATSESILKKLKWEAREKELERKVEAFRRGQVEREEWNRLDQLVTTSFACTYNKGS
jgi:hypothetical protein